MTPKQKARALKNLNESISKILLKIEIQKIKRAVTERRKTEHKKEKAVKRIQKEYETN
jgi:DNA-binding protein H-NS